MIDWLPNLILLDDHRGIWQEFLDAVHTQFEQDFIVSKPTWPNKRVALKGILKLLKKLLSGI